MQPPTDTWSTQDAINAFRLHCQAQRYRQSTLDFYACRLPPFAAWLAGESVATVNGILPQHVRAYIAYKANGNSGHYIHSIARALRAWLNFCVAEEMISASPMRNVPMPKKPKNVLAALTAADIRKLVRAARDDRETALIHFLIDTGVRAAECVALKVGDVNFATGQVQIHAGKGEKDRVVYIGGTTGRQLLRHVRRNGLVDRDPLFPSEHDGRHLLRNGLSQLLRRISRRAGVPAGSAAHAYRRTYALNSVRNGMDLYTLARLMGHADIDVLKQYLAFVQQDLEDAAAKFGVIDNL